MNSSPQPISVSSVEKQYLYRNAWSQTVTVLVTGGLGTGLLAWLALSKDLAWLWLVAMIFLILFGLGLWITIVNIQGKLRFKVSQEGIYVPLIWNSRSYAFVSFSEINDVEFIQAYGNMIFEVSAGKKKYPITKSWFPNKGDFEEIVSIIQARLPAHLRHTTG